MPIVRLGEAPPVTISAARLILLSESLTSDDLSARSGLRPDATWKRGAPRGSAGALQKFHGWELKSGIPANADPAAHVRGLLDRLRPGWEQLKALIRDEPTIDARLWVSQHIENWNPEFYFEPTVVQDIADLGVAVSVDVYCYEPGELTDRKTRH